MKLTFYDLSQMTVIADLSNKIDELQDDGFRI